MRLRGKTSGLLCACVCLGLAAPLAAQDWSFDARRIALGGSGPVSNLAMDTVEEPYTYRTIVIPFGLFQILRDIDIYNPDSTAFDPVRAVEYAASPIHFVVDRDSSASGQAFVTAIRNGAFTRDLNAYRGFEPVTDITGGGVAAPSWGGTFRMSRAGAPAVHRIYVGAGPYLSVKSTTHFDERLSALLGSESPVYVPNAQMPIMNGSQFQGAAAFTGGYRGRFPIAGGSGSGQEGVYVAANFNYLRGFRYEDESLTVRFDTDTAGLLTVVPGRPAPVLVGRQYSTKGNGFAIDAGAGAIVKQWAVGFAVNGIANRINWTDVSATAYFLDSLLSSDGEFSESATTSIGTLRVELPVEYRGNVSYFTPLWTATAEAGRGLGGASFHGGLERRWKKLAARGGARYTLQRWNPSGGVGFDISRRIGVDVSAFGTTANIERKRKLALATSLRINR